MTRRGSSEVERKTSREKRGKNKRVGEVVKLYRRYSEREDVGTFYVRRRTVERVDTKGRHQSRPDHPGCQNDRLQVTNAGWTRQISGFLGRTMRIIFTECK